MRTPKTSTPGRRSGLALRTGAGAVLDDASIGRIEEWVVSTLDGLQRPPNEADWREALADFTVAKRPEGFRRVPEGPAEGPDPGAWARFRLARGRGIAVVSLTDQALVREDDLAELAGDLRALVEAGHLRIVLDFAAVERLSSWAARAIDEVARACGSTPGGSVKFAGLRPELAAVFAMTGLDPSVATYPDVASAIAGLWPDRPALRPLPVPILAALMRAEDARPARHRPIAPGPSGRVAEGRSAMIDARLIVQDGPSIGRSVAIKGARFVIGRGPDCQLRLGSVTVSRAHAAIERRGRRFFLRDLSSTNGSRLNGRRLGGREVEVGDGDRIQFGPLSFELAIGEVEGPESVRPDGPRAWAGFDDGPGSTQEFAEIDDAVGFKHEVVEGVLVVTPTAPELDEAEAVDSFRDGLLALLARPSLPRRVVVNLTHVGHLSGRAIGVLVAHQLRLDRSVGALRVCLANPRVALILEQVKLGMFIDCHPTVDEAVIAAWPEPVAAHR